MPSVATFLSSRYYLSLLITLAGLTPAFAQTQSRGVPKELTLEILHANSSTLHKDVDSICGILKGRFASLGISDLNLQPDYDKNKIALKVTWPYGDERLITYASATGKLEFDETYTNEEFFPYLLAANDSMAATLPPAYVSTVKSKTEEFKYRNPVFSVLRPFIANDGSALLPGPIVATIAKKDTGKLDSLLQLKLFHWIWPKDVQLVFGRNDEQSSMYHVYATKLPAKKTDLITEKNIRLARAVNDEKYTRQQVVVLEMNARGTKKWQQMTTANIGKYVAIVFENTVYSCPRVMDTITKGGAMIADKLSLDQSNDIANVLNNGSFPLPVRVIEPAAKDIDKK